MKKRAVILEIKLPNAADRSIKAQGIVAWANCQGKRKKMTLPPGFGVEFTNVAEEDNMVIKAFVEGTRGKE